MMYVIDLFVTISRRNDIVVPMPCYDIIVVRSLRRCRMSRSYDSCPISVNRWLVTDLYELWNVHLWMLIHWHCFDP